MFSRAFVAGFLLMACLALAACGSDSDTTGAGGTDATTADSAEAGKGGETTSDGSTEESTTEEGEDASSGGSSATPTVTGPSLKKAEYVKKGDEICGKVPQAFQPLFQKASGELEEEEKKQKKKFSETEKEEVVNLKAAIPPLGPALEEFGELGSPEGDEEFAQEVIDALAAAKSGLEDDPSLPLTGKGSPFEEFVKLTKGYGFQSCPQL